ncbi:MAG TPA: nucleotide sugar dehydrogenase [Candidatus Paceibacterota bacterium]|nr:nucleotide sugar dehydrogenase [Candidatus Pacearchaeota archaeon]HRZ50683.1 nucleotide sugar dehydrogenase [Candidatus Paceibacterota bacterium]HSA36420.1 nucleotide sugar dehydrogenase [Candidatus Paceibacterota bacterium]
MNLYDLIKKKKAKTAIIGMGYVGLPHALEIARAGMQVFGIDIQQKRTNLLNAGKSYIQDVKDSELQEIIDARKFQAFADFSKLAEADVIIICVPTPLDKYKIPDVSYIVNSVNEIKKYFRPGQLVILESTTYPGTTDEVILPILQESGLKCGQDFYLAFAPERIDPGNTMPLNEVPKVVGGITKECTALAVLFYSQFLKHVHPVSTARAAEMTKILENTYRLINISAINELAMLAGKMDIDIWEVIEAAKTKPYGFQAFYPSPKVGGHCIPLDPFYLSWKAKEYNFWAHFIELAGEINDQMPHYTVTSVITALNRQGKALKGSKILVWGVAYKKDIDDPREGAAYDVIPNLMRKGAQVDYFDSLIPEFRIPAGNFMLGNSDPIILKSIENGLEAAKNYDAVIILCDNSGFDYVELAKNASLVIDTRNAIKSREFKNVYRF